MNLWYVILYVTGYKPRVCTAVEYEPVICDIIWDRVYRAEKYLIQNMWYYPWFENYNNFWLVKTPGMKKNIFPGVTSHLANQKLL